MPIYRLVALAGQGDKLAFISEATRRFAECASESNRCKGRMLSFAAQHGKGVVAMVMCVSTQDLYGRGRANATFTMEGVGTPGTGTIYGHANAPYGKEAERLNRSEEEVSKKRQLRLARKRQRYHERMQERKGK